MDRDEIPPDGRSSMAGAGLRPRIDRTEVSSDPRNTLPDTECFGDFGCAEVDATAKLQTSSIDLFHPLTSRTQRYAKSVRRSIKHGSQINHVHQRPIAF